MGENQWVSPRDGKWAVHGEGNKRDTAIFNTQAEAQARAIQIATAKHSEVIVQRPNGQIRSKDSYGHDPLPPRDTEH